MKKNTSLTARTRAWSLHKWAYLSEGIWTDTRRSWKINFIKTLNLSVRSFLDRGLQNQAAAMTYRTVLAIVPALAILFAIGRGFGIQDSLQSQLFIYFPAQREALRTAFTFVNSYLENASSQGVFLGVGIIFLVYTVVSLLSSVESSFNSIWGIKRGRSFFRKITDYTAILLILPILLLCSSGITFLMSSTLEAALPSQLEPAVAFLVEFVGLSMLWLFYTGVYLLVPNTRVKVKNALIAGILAGTAFAILQWLFVTGQLYVTRYNAIYGSVAFLPLLLIWLHLVWLVTLSGGVLCYSSQSIFEFSFNSDIAHIAINYRRKIVTGICAVIVSNYEQEKQPLDEYEISITYGLPISLVTKSVNTLVEAGIISRVVRTEKNGVQITGLAPAFDPNKLTLGVLFRRLDAHGTHDFIPEYNERFENVVNSVEKVDEAAYKIADEIPIKDLKFKSA